MQPIKKILFATDFSPTSHKAGEMAAFLKETLACEVEVVHVYDTNVQMQMPYAETAGVESWLDEHFSNLKDQGRGAMEELCSNLGIGCHGHQLEGHPGETIVRFANEKNVDLIIMGTHGLSGFKRLVMGSVAEYVLRHASCGVMTIKDSRAA